jgi:hypothetical protein
MLSSEDTENWNAGTPHLDYATTFDEAPWLRGIPDHDRGGQRRRYLSCMPLGCRLHVAATIIHAQHTTLSTAVCIRNSST